MGGHRREGLEVGFHRGELLGKTRISKSIRVLGLEYTLLFLGIWRIPLGKGAGVVFWRPLFAGGELKKSEESSECRGFGTTF